MVERKKEKVGAVIVAAGKGERMGDVDKMFASLGGEPLLLHTTRPFQQCSQIDQIVVVVSGEREIQCRHLVTGPDWPKVSDVCLGGRRRQDSVAEGLKRLAGCNLVVIHDGARPVVLPSDIDRVVQVAISDRAALLAVRATDTVKRAREGFVLNTLERGSLFLAQTPQVFQYDLIMAAYKDAANDADIAHFTDDASLVEARGFKVRVVEPTGPNLKVTTRDDLILVEALLKRELDEES